jgi:phosphatidylserine/phosphatidylglycerophosphate/cardiolipin synthase-like enzyme
LQYLLKVADCPEHHGWYQVQWWCAQDAKYKYCIKNHAKCTVIDRQVAIFGGSNFVPTVQAACSDLDLLVVGPIAAQGAETVNLLWNALEERGEGSVSLSTTTAAPAKGVGPGSLVFLERV